MMKQLFFFFLSLLWATASLAQSGSGTEAPDFGLTFIPDHIFNGSDLKGWHVAGHAVWQADHGEITESSKSGGGLLVADTAYQDIGFHGWFKYDGTGEVGILFRIQKTNGGMKGVLLSITPRETAPYLVTLNGEGKVITRERLRYAGGISYRIAPPPQKVHERGPGRGRNSFPAPRPAPVPLPIAQPNTAFRPNQWNQIEVYLDENVLRASLNDGAEIGGAIDDDDFGINGYGPFALYVSGPGRVQFKNIMRKDIAYKRTPPEKISSRFRLQRISDMYYSWGATTGDFNRDGQPDIIAGPYIYFGPDFTRRREIYPAIAANPSLEFNNNHVEDTYDFNGDGWPDVLYSAFSTTLYINPRGASRRWKSYNVLPGVQQSEITEFLDIDGDGVPELVYSAGGYVSYAKFDPADPTKPWHEYHVSQKGYGLGHGIGTGDINGDGRTDILDAFGWWEQPRVPDTAAWVYHPAVLGRYGHRTNHIGGSVMGVYDVNGDGLNDVVTSLNAHGFGLAWFEQHRDARGKISFIMHLISDDYSYPHNAGGVTFSQGHGNTFCDVDGDGVEDLVIGKRYWTHLDNYYDPDPYGPPVLYWYRTVRDPKAPGGARFVPELIHNRSGAGSQVDAKDLNGDGTPDIITSTDRGTFIFWNNIKK